MYFKNTKIRGHGAFLKEYKLVTNGRIYEQEKLRGLSPRANYTDRAAAAGRRS